MASDPGSSDPWYYPYLRNITSQNGEDGVLAEIFERIGIANRYCVEVGANDGFFISNTYSLLHDAGWSGVLIEADGKNYSDLALLYQSRDDVVCLQRFVDDTNTIASLIAQYDVPEDFDLLSIDIDGMDFQVWSKLEGYRPRVVVIETNCSMAPDVRFVQTDPAAKFGASAASMVDLARHKGYELVAHLMFNCVFVRKEDYPRIRIQDNRLESMFMGMFVPKVVTDLKGVHHILREGQHGFGGAVLASPLHGHSESPTDVSEKQQRLIDDSGVYWVTRKDLPYRAAVTGKPSDRGILRAFHQRMVAALAERAEMRAKLRAKT